MRSTAWGLDASTGEDWRLRAACRGEDPEWWATGNPGNKRAKVICSGCPVIDDCRAFADRIGANGMIFAGVVYNTIGDRATPQPAVCVRCRRTFLRDRAWTKFCTPACRVAWHNNRGQ